MTANYTSAANDPSAALTSTVIPSSACSTFTALAVMNHFLLLCVCVCVVFMFHALSCHDFGKVSVQMSGEEATSPFLPDDRVCSPPPPPQTSEYLKSAWGTLPLWKETLAHKQTCTGAEVAVGPYGLLYSILTHPDGESAFVRAKMGCILLSQV